MKELKVNSDIEYVKQSYRLPSFEITPCSAYGWLQDKLFAWSKWTHKWYLVRDVAPANIKTYRETLKAYSVCTCLVKK